MNHNIPRNICRDVDFDVEAVEYVPFLLGLDDMTSPRLVEQIG
jgi:hypothetical protein